MHVTPLHEAAMFGHKHVCELLIERGADVDAKTRDLVTPLHRAARAGHHAVVKLLLEHHATTNNITVYNMTSLDYAKDAKERYEKEEKS